MRPLPDRTCRPLADLLRPLAAAALALLLGGAGAASLEGVLSPGELIQGHVKAEADCENCHLPFKKTGQDELCEKCHKEVGKDVAARLGFHGHIKDRGLCRSCHTDHKGRGAKVVVFDEKKFNHDESGYPLKDSHGKVECKKCHLPKKKWREAPSNCYACHKKDDDKDGHKGTLGEKCEDCHTIKKWKDTFFDHDKTKFPLRDTHADPKVKCADCHPNNKFKHTPLACNECHKKDDDRKGHKGAFGLKCETCHTAKDWKTVKFEHDRDTKYPLKGGHRSTKCVDCHPKRLYEDHAPKACVGCHKKDDKHKGTLGDKCQDCHIEKNWKESPNFDHDKTKFPLKGKHADPKVLCKDCHESPVFKDAPLDCWSCHKKDDDRNGHKGSFGKKCETCHAEKEWKTVKFDHDRDTKYALRGRHRTAKCVDCHQKRLYEDKTPGDCYSCHQKDDDRIGHKGKEGKRCEDCHFESDWKTTRNKFDHDLTAFPLLGKHVKVACEKCHETHEFRDAKVACDACHEKDDKHKRRLGQLCEDCHNAVDWKRWSFDHDTRTRFKLDGAHAKVGCYACHKDPVKGRALLPMNCVACHDADDAHAGSFGKQCERCHVTRSWKDIRNNRLGAVAPPPARLARLPAAPTPLVSG